MVAKRPIIKISDLRRLGALQCTKREAAGFLGVGIKTFNRALSSNEKALKAWEDGQQVGKVSLRRKQFNLASVSTPMAIFLGKQILGQKDITTSELTGPDGSRLESHDLERLNAQERAQLRELLNGIRRPE